MRTFPFIKSLAISFFLLLIPQLVLSQSAINSFVQIASQGRMSTSVTERARGVLSKTLVDVDARLLRDGGKVQAQDRAVRKDAGKGTRMQLPDGTIITLITTRLQSFIKGVETYTGRVKELDSGFFTFSIENNKVFGRVSIEYMTYELQYDTVYRSHVLIEVDQSKVPRHTPNPVTNGSAFIAATRSVKGTVQMSNSVNGTVRILIVYGSDVTNINTLASNIISEMNDSFFDDGMNPDYNVTLANLRNLNDNLAGVCKESILAKMEHKDAPFANILSWRNADHADVVLSIATTDFTVTNCPQNFSYGRIGGQASDLLNINKPYAVTMDTYAIGDLTALHEIGHVLGGGHDDWSVQTLQQFSSLTESYSRGYISSTGNWQTIMGSYNSNGCDFSTNLSNPDCVRILRWSDPNKAYSGEIRGVAYTSDSQVPFSADMKSALVIQMPIAAAFESYPYSAPAVPGHFRVIRDYCYGLNTARWKSVSTAVNYQLQRSYSSNFINPEVIYFGPDTSIEVTAGQNQSLYLKVRACNGSGCGDLSVQKTANYYNGCL